MRPWRFAAGRVSNARRWKALNGGCGKEDCRNAFWESARNTRECGWQFALLCPIQQMNTEASRKAESFGSGLLLLQRTGSQSFSNMPGVWRVTPRHKKKPVAAKKQA
jgi:hypothetical protein